MNKNLYSNFHPAVQLIFMLLITIVSFFFVMIAALIIGVVVYRVPVNEWMGLLDMNNPANLGVLKFIQITQALALFVIPPIIVGLLAIGKPFKYLGLRTATAGSDLLLVMLILLVSLPVFNLLAIWNEGLQLPSFMSGIEHWMKATEEQAGQLTEKFLAAGSFGTYLINVIMIALIPAFGEEFMFRGVIQRQLGQWFKNPHWAIVITAVLF
ncbi:MAG: CPBP family intramembrane metalloprotease, partial [Bacteroidales bacterium]|nr:CPBP family intramembrane metalloprotease [Bacteroidales bacterium]